MTKLPFEPLGALPDDSGGYGTVAGPSVLQQMDDSQSRHVIGLWRACCEVAKAGPQCIENNTGVCGLTAGKFAQEAVFSELFLAAEDLGKSIGVKQKPTAGREGEGLAGVGHVREQAKRRAGGADPVSDSVGGEDEAGIVTGVEHLNLGACWIEAGEDGGDVASARFLTLLPVVLVGLACECFKGNAARGHGAKGRAKAGGHERGGQTFAGDIGDGEQDISVGMGEDIDIVAANLVAGFRADGERESGQIGQVARDERTLDVACCIEVFLDARPLEIALEVAGVFDGDCGLQGESMDEIQLVEGECTKVRREDDEGGEGMIVVISKWEGAVGGDGVGRRYGERFGNFAEGDRVAGSGQESGAGHFEFKDDDAEDGAKDGFLGGGGVDLARDLEQGLKARNLLLEIDGSLRRGGKRAGSFGIGSHRFVGDHGFRSSLVDGQEVRVRRGREPTRPYQAMKR